MTLSLVSPYLVARTEKAPLLETSPAIAARCRIGPEITRCRRDESRNATKTDCFSDGRFGHHRLAATRLS